MAAQACTISAVDTAERREFLHGTLWAGRSAGPKKASNARKGARFKACCLCQKDSSGMGGEHLCPVLLFFKSEAFTKGTSFTWAVMNDVCKWQGRAFFSPTNMAPDNGAG